MDRHQRVNALRLVLRAIAAIGGVLTLVIVAFLIWREIGQSANEQDAKIDTPPGINVLESVKIGGIEQIIQIRGTDTRNPVILLFHGGPGSSFLSYAYEFQTGWEDYFTVVHWEQRGTGLTYNLHGDSIAETISLERMVLDGIEVAEYVTKRLNQEKVVLLGHSFGSALAVAAVLRRPNLFHAYIGVGQVVNNDIAETISYEFVLESAMAAGDEETLDSLAKIGPPPYGTDFEEYSSKLGAQRALLTAYDGVIFGSQGYAEFIRMMLLAPSLPLGYITYVVNGSNLSQRALFEDFELNFGDIRELGTSFEIPVFFFLGRHDYTVPASLSAEYFKDISAPAKELVWFEHAAHTPFLTQPAAFQNALIERVLPVTKMQIQ